MSDNKHVDFGPMMTIVIQYPDGHWYRCDPKRGRCIRDDCTIESLDRANEQVVVTTAW